MARQLDPKWVAYFKLFISSRLVRGGKINPIFINHINKAFTAVKLRPFVVNDQTSISGSFLGGIFTAVGLEEKLPRSFYRPIDWQSAGAELKKPAYGCVAIVRCDGGEKVGIVLGQTSNGSLKILIAHHDSEVNITDHIKENIIAYRWVGETDTPSLHRYELPVLKSGVIKSKLFIERV